MQFFREISFHTSFKIGQFERFYGTIEKFFPELMEFLFNFKLNSSKAKNNFKWKCQTKFLSFLIDRPG